MEHLPEIQLKKERTLVKVFTNEIMIIEKFFYNKDMRGEWMQRVVEALKGINNVYFEVSYYYTQRKINQYEYVKKHRSIRKATTLMQPPSTAITKPEKIKFVTPKPFEKPPAIYSNTQWNEL